MDPDQLLAKYDAIRTEYHICKRKLDSKCEALLILSKELDECRSERDQFKLMAEQLRARYQDIKRQINGLHPISSANSLDPRFYSDMQSQSLAKLLCETKEQSKSLQFEVDDLKQKLQDAQGDIKLLREQIARQRVGTTDEGMNTRHFPAYEREDLVRQLEASREQYLQLERDLQQVLDEKEEQVTERDIYRTKYERLNQELNYILRGDEKRIIDIDALSMENKYLKDRLKQMEEEKTIAMATVSKYKSILERKKNKGILKFGPVGQSRSGGVVISQKQVQQLLENQSGRTASPQALQDLQALASALLDTVNDKNLAISHQRKTNKILGNRVSELEKKLKTLEVSGLWNIPANLTCLEKLRAECEEVKTLLPQDMSETSQTSQTSPPESWQKLQSVMSPSSPSSSIPSPSHTASETTATKPEKPPVSLEDLDLLPTRDDSGKSLKFAEVKESIMNAFGK
ncbi:coiled-coil domain-containing protein 149-like isoform X2 [Liolophura sinensis]|uniref:coiled-coil domain-containing protein 149-like isoform X2 n=1 Tax=Liolophura sinensis TaxID=3198878 RepID=UPI0031594570